MQASGEAKYSGDMMLDGSELYAYIVKSQRALATIKSVDPSDALQVTSPPPPSPPPPPPLGWGSRGALSVRSLVNIIRESGPDMAPCFVFPIGSSSFLTCPTPIRDSCPDMAPFSGISAISSTCPTVRHLLGPRVEFFVLALHLTILPAVELPAFVCLLLSALLTRVILISCCRISPPYTLGHPEVPCCGKRPPPPPSLPLCNVSPFFWLEKSRHASLDSQSNFFS